MLRAVLVLAIATTLGATLGVVLYGLNRPPAPSPAAVATPISAPTPTAPATPTPRTEARLRGDPAAQTVRLIVNQDAYLMQERALQERDDRTLFWVWNTFEKLDVETGSRVRVLKRDQAGVQVEVLEGPYAGRRGWVSEFYLGS